jgi:hypothetical protein
MMHSKWTDALIQILAFDRVEDPSKELMGEPFCEHIVRLFMQVSASHRSRGAVHCSPNRHQVVASSLPSDRGASAHPLDVPVALTSPTCIPAPQLSALATMYLQGESLLPPDMSVSGTAGRHGRRCAAFPLRRVALMRHVQTHSKLAAGHVLITLMTY